MPKGILSPEQRLTQNVSRLKTLNAKLRFTIASLKQGLAVALESNATKAKPLT